MSQFQVCGELSIDSDLWDLVQDRVYCAVKALFGHQGSPCSYTTVIAGWPHKLMSRCCE